MSGNIIGGVVGAAIGFVIGGPAGASYGWMIGSVAGGLLMPPHMEGPRLDDRRPQGSEYGRAIPIVKGTGPVQGNVIWQTDLVEVASDSGGKGGPETTSFAYFANFAVLLCEGEVGLGRIWAGPEKRLIYDGKDLEGSDSGAKITFYNGSETQLPDPLMEAHEGVGNVPAYRGCAYIVFENFPVANDGNRIPFLTVEVGNVTTTAANLGTAYTIDYYVNEAAGTYVVPVWGGSDPRVIVRNLADNSFVANYDGSALPLGGDRRAQFFVDPDRNRLVYVGGGVRYMDLASGAVTVVNGDTLHMPTVAGATDIGTSGIVGMYHGGLYLFLAQKASTGRFTINAIDPDTLTAAWTYTGDAACPTRVYGPMYHVSDGDAFVFVHRGDGKILKVPLTPNFNTTLCGNAATVEHSFDSYVSSRQDPSTGYVWSWNEGPLTIGADFTVTYYVTDLAAASNLHTGTMTWSYNQLLGGGDFAFVPATMGLPGTPHRAIFCQSEKVGYGVDFLTVLDADTTFDVIEGGTLGSHSWVSGLWIKPGFWNPVSHTYWFGRGLSGYINRSASDLLSFSDVAMKLEQGSAFGVYLGDAGLQVAGTTLDLVVADLCRRAGLAPAEIDVTDLAGDTVDGYVIQQQTTVRGAIQVIAPVYLFDAVESAGAAKFVKRGGPIRYTIPDEHLSARQAGTDPEQDLIETTRVMEDELPQQLTVSYINRNADYETMTKASRRLVGASGDAQTLDAPLVLTDTKAQGVADVNLHQAWVRRRTFAFSLPMLYADLEPTDVVSVRGQAMVLLRVQQADDFLKCEAAFDDFNYVPHVLVTETPVSGKTVYQNAETLVELM